MSRDGVTVLQGLRDEIKELSSLTGVNIVKRWD